MSMITPIVAVTSSSTMIDSLSIDVVSYLFTFLPPLFLGKVVSLVSSTWSKIVSNGSLWIELNHIHFGSHPGPWIHREITPQDYCVQKIRMKNVSEVFRWESHPKPKCLPRSLYTANAYKKWVILIGGLSIGAGLSDIIFHDTVMQTYSFPEIKGVPQGFGINRHVSGLIGHKIYLFGGRNSPEAPKINNLYILDLVKMTLKCKVPDDTFPAPRSDHAGAVVGNRFYIFGGSDQNIRPLNDLHYYDVTEKKWSCVTPQPLPVMTRCYYTSEKKWLEIHTKGAPTPRSAMRMVSIGKTLYVFGGGIRDFSVRCMAKTNELHSFDTETLIWKRLTPSGPSPNFSSFSCALSVGVFIFLGLGSGLGSGHVTSSCMMYDTVSDELITLDNLPRIPQPRDGAACALVGDCIYVHGGQFLKSVERLKLSFLDHRCNVSKKRTKINQHHEHDNDD